MHCKRTQFSLTFLVLVIALLVITESHVAVAPSTPPPRIYVVPPRIIPYDNDTPTISISMPTNIAYDSNSISLNFTITKPQSWNNDTISFANVTEYFGQIDEVSYNLDGQWAEANMSTPDNWFLKEPISFSINISGLANGLHFVSINASAWSLFAPSLFAYRFANNIESNSDLVEFVVNVAPKVSVLFPENTVYNETSNALIFTIDKQVSSMWYSLDGAANVTINGNITLTQLTDRQHDLQVYAQVPTGNVGFSGTMSFRVDLPPKITLLAPDVKPYNTSTIPLEFTTDKPVAWIGYSLDGQNNTAIAGNTTLCSLPDGNHTIAITAIDAFGNEGRSRTISFTRYPVMASTPPPSSVSFVIEQNAGLLAGTALAIIASISIFLLALRRRHRHSLAKMPLPLNKQV